MERRGFAVAAVLIGGVVCAVGLAIATDACRAHLYASWLAGSGPGPPADLPVPCVPSRLASRYALEFLLPAVSIAAVMGGLAFVMLIARRIVGAERSFRAERVVGWMNVGALGLMMAAAVGIAGSGEGELQFYATPWLLLGCVPAAIGSFAGVRKPPGAFAAM